MQKIRQKMREKIRQKGPTNHAHLQLFFVLRMTPQLAERWMQKGSTKQVGALRPCSDLSAEAQQEGITKQGLAAPVQPFFALQMAPLLAERWTQKIVNSHGVSASKTAAAIHLASDMGPT